jgi:RimJ/RimL family protein N-acetyltransferase
LIARLDEQVVLTSRRVRLEAFSETNLPEVSALDLVRTYFPRTAHAFRRVFRPSLFGPPLLVRSVASSRALGVISNNELSDAPGVAEVSLFVDPRLSAPGWPLEAYRLYVRYLFDHGAAKIQITVYDFDEVGLRMLAKLRFQPQAILRQHAYVAGFLRDVHIFGSTCDALFGEADARLARLLRVGTR